MTPAPISHVSRALTILGCALGAWLLVVLVSRSAALQAARQTIADQKEENAAKVEAVYRLSREMIRQESLKVVQAERALARARASAGKTLDSANMATLTNMAVLQDSAATVPQLRTALSSQIATTDALAQQFREYLQSDSSAHALIDAERASVYRLLTLADSTIAAKNEALEAWKLSARPLPWYKKVAKSLCIGGVSAGAAGAGAAIGDVQGAAIGALSGVIVGTLSCR